MTEVRPVLATTTCTHCGLAITLFGADPFFAEGWLHDPREGHNEPFQEICLATATLAAPTPGFIVPKPEQPEHEPTMDELDPAPDDPEETPR